MRYQRIPRFIPFAVLVLLCWLGVVSALALDSDISYSEFYYGPDDENIATGAELSVPELNMTGERIELDFSGFTGGEGQEKYGVLMRYAEDKPELREATVRLTDSSLALDGAGATQDFNVAAFMNGFDTSLFSLTQGSSLSVDVSSNYGFMFGVMENSGNISEVILDEGSTINVSHSVNTPLEATAAAGSGFGCGIYTHAELARLSLDNGSGINVDTRAYTPADAESTYSSSTGAFVEGNDVNIALNNEAYIHTTATGDESSEGATMAIARGIELISSNDITISIEGSSLINVQATATGAPASTYLIKADAGTDVEFILTDSTLTGNVATDGPAMAFGPVLGADMGVSATLTDSNIEVDAESSGNVAVAEGFIVGNVADVDLSLTRSSIAVSALAEDSAANAVGVEIFNASSVKFSLADSDVESVARAVGGKADAMGLYLNDSTAVNSLTLERASIFSFATADDTDAVVGEAFSVGLNVVGDMQVENLSLVSSYFMSGASAETGEAISYGVLVEGSEATPELTLNIDEHSGILADWSVHRADGVVHLNNSGMLAGRLLVSDLSNSASGSFMVSLASDDLMLAADGIGYFEEEDFYFNVDGRAQLADGTTFMVFTYDDLGIKAEGDSTSIALLSADEGDWTLENLELGIPYDTPMLGLELSENTAGNQLIATATFLTPEQAGLSHNATAAYRAAAADGVFTIVSTPEEWSPNVSGAFIAGMAQTLKVSNMNIDNRLGMLNGMTRGDEIAASNGMWYSARFSDAEQDQREGIEGFDADTNALSLGYDREFGNVVLGLAYTRGKTDAKANDDSSDFDMLDNMISLYASYAGEKWFSAAVVSAGFGSVDSMRNVGFDQYEGDFDSTSYNALVKTGCNISAADWEFYPYLSLEYSYKDYDSYTEVGDSLALHIHAEDYQVFSAGVGTRVQKDFRRSWGIVTPEVSARIAYDMDNDRIVSTANFVGGTRAFVAKGIEPSETSWDLGAALTIASLGEQNVSLRLGYDYSGRQDFDSHSFTGKVRFEF